MRSGFARVPARRVLGRYEDPTRPRTPAPPLTPKRWSWRALYRPRVLLAAFLPLRILAVIGLTAMVAFIVRERGDVTGVVWMRSAVLALMAWTLMAQLRSLAGSSYRRRRPTRTGSPAGSATLSAVPSRRLVEPRASLTIAPIARRGAHRATLSSMSWWGLIAAVIGVCIVAAFLTVDWMLDDLSAGGAGPWLAGQVLLLTGAAFAIGWTIWLAARSAADIRSRRRRPLVQRFLNWLVRLLSFNRGGTISASAGAHTGTLSSTAVSQTSSVAPVGLAAVSTTAVGHHATAAGTPKEAEASTGTGAGRTSTSQITSARGLLSGGPASLLGHTVVALAVVGVSATALGVSALAQQPNEVSSTAGAAEVGGVSVTSSLAGPADAGSSSVPSNPDPAPQELDPIAPLDPAANGEVVAPPDNGGGQPPAGPPAYGAGTPTPPVAPAGPPSPPGDVGVAPATPAAPGPTATSEPPTATPNPIPTQRPTATQTPAPSPRPTTTPTQRPTATPTPTATPRPTATPTQRPTATPTPTATPRPTATPTPTTCTVRGATDTDCDEISDKEETRFGSNPLDPQSTPEMRTYDVENGTSTCADGVDNDLDRATDAADPGCGG